MNQSLDPVLTTDYYFDTTPYEGEPKPVRGPMLSVGAITRVGAKASFVFDSMVGFFNHDYHELQTTTIFDSYYDSFGQWQPGLYQHEIVKKSSKSTAFFLMPGMRFQKDERRAFQVSLAGVVLSDGGETVSIPIPFCTWFYRF